MRACTCVCVCIGLVIGSWFNAGLHQIGVVVVVVVSLSKKLNSHCSSLPSYLIGGLVSTGEVAHQAVTAVGTWY